MTNQFSFPPQRARRAKGGAVLPLDLPLFEWGRNQTLLTDPVVRRLLRLDVSARRWRASTASSSDWEVGMREASLMHHRVRDEFFANSEPSVCEWQRLRGAGVALHALCRPTMILVGNVVVDRPTGFSFAQDGDADGQRAFLIAINDEDGRFLDIAGWQPARSWTGLWLGTAWALGQASVLQPRMREMGAMTDEPQDHGWRAHLDLAHAAPRCGAR